MCKKMSSLSVKVFKLVHCTRSTFKKKRSILETPLWLRQYIFQNEPFQFYKAYFVNCACFISFCCLKNNIPFTFIYIVNG